MTIKCEICGKDRPQIEMVPVSAEEEDQYNIVCIYCLEAEMNELEMMSQEPLYPSLGVIEEEG